MEQSHIAHRKEGRAMTSAAPATQGKTHEFTTQNSADTVAVGRKLVELLKPPQLLLLRGELGTGKTTLVADEDAEGEQRPGHAICTASLDHEAAQSSCRAGAC
jgi:hypothetical protein